MPSPSVIQALSDFHTVAELQGFRREAAAALVSRSTKPIVINALGRDGQSSAGINLADKLEIEEFIEACKAAEDLLDGVTTTNPDELGIHKDYSRNLIE